jgi:hypothetical protein
MSILHLAAADEAIGTLGYNGANLVVAQHWLTCWRKGAPPRMGGFRAEVIWRHKPAMMFCRVAKDQSLTCVRGGALLRVALGFDISNTDLLSLVPESQRVARLDWAWAITEGAVTVLYRQFKSKDGHEGFAQGIALPFSGEDAEGGRFFVMHTNWRPVGAEWIIGNVDVDLKNPSSRRMISFVAKPEEPAAVVGL